MMPAILFYAALPFALFYFFTYVSFDYAKLEPISRGAVLFQVVLCLVPFFIFQFSKQETRADDLGTSRHRHRIGSRSNRRAATAIS
jgi:hypothetical protein